MIRALMVAAACCTPITGFCEAHAEPISNSSTIVLPSPLMTPGATDPAVTVAVICAHNTRSRRGVSSSIRDRVLEAYNVRTVDRIGYELDHLVPLALGGTNAASNLWPQDKADAAKKDQLEIELQRLVCHGLLPLDQAQREIADDWVEAYERYVQAPAAR